MIPISTLSHLTQYTSIAFSFFIKPVGARYIDKEPFGYSIRPDDTGYFVIEGPRRLQDYLPGQLQITGAELLTHAAYDEESKRAVTEKTYKAGQ